MFKFGCSDKAKTCFSSFRVGLIYELKDKNSRNYYYYYYYYYYYN